MNKPLNQLSASSLRRILLDEVRDFVESLDLVTLEKLQEKRERLIAINKALSEKEMLDKSPLVWGRKKA